MTYNTTERNEGGVSKHSALFPRSPSGRGKNRFGFKSSPAGSSLRSDLESMSPSRDRHRLYARRQSRKGGPCENGSDTLSHEIVVCRWGGCQSSPYRPRAESSVARSETALCARQGARIDLVPRRNSSPQEGVTKTGLTLDVSGLFLTRILRSIYRIGSSP